MVLQHPQISAKKLVSETELKTQTHQTDFNKELALKEPTKKAVLSRQHEMQLVAVIV